MQLCGFDLVPGDAILYSSNSVIDTIIEEKTGGIAAHVEIYVSEGQSIASRNGIGVGQYATRTDSVVAILRPTASLDLVSGIHWFDSVNHDGYDWVGLLNFFTPFDIVVPHKLFCSAFGVEFYRNCDFAVIARRCPSNKISPSDYLKLPCFTWVYCVDIE